MGVAAFGDIVWMHLRHGVAHKKCYVKARQRGRYRLNRAARARVIKSVWEGAPKAMQTHRLELCWALAVDRLTHATALWLALRPGLFEKPQLRLLSVAWAMYAAKASGLRADPEARKYVDDVLFDVKQLAFSDGEAASLHKARQYASDLMGLTMRAGAYFPKEQQDAVMAVSATTLPSTPDAAFAALNWAYSTVHPTPPPPIPYKFVPGDFGKTTVDSLHDQVFKDLARLVVAVASDTAQLLEEEQTARLRKEAEEVFDDNVDPTSDLWD